MRYWTYVQTTKKYICQITVLNLLCQIDLYISITHAAENWLGSWQTCMSNNGFLWDAISSISCSFILFFIFNFALTYPSTHENVLTYSLCPRKIAHSLQSLGNFYWTHRGTVILSSFYLAILIFLQILADSSLVFRNMTPHLFKSCYL